MILLLTDPQFQTVGLILVAIIGIVPATLAAIWSRTAKANSAEAKENSASALHEVMTNGGMSDPNPNLNDHVKYQTQMAERLLDVALPLVSQVNEIDERFKQHLQETQPVKELVEQLDKNLNSHIKHSQVMDKALAEVYLKVKPDVHLGSEDLED